MDLETIITTFIDKQTPVFAEKAVKLYKKGHQEGADVEEFKEELTELFFEYAALVMAQVLAYLRDEYDVNVSPLNEEELTSMFYSKDGKTIFDRIDEYVKTNNLITFTYYIYRFLRTETVVISNMILFHKLKNVFRYVRVKTNNCCEYCEDEELGILATWTSCENVSVYDLPPWHPECRCMLEFSNEKSKSPLPQEEM